MIKIKLENIRKTFDQKKFVLENLNLEINENEFVVLIGPSGCGKTTLLNIIAGLEKPTSGDIFIEGNKVNNVEPKDRNISMVFQNYALYPHLTVFENMAFPLKIKKMDKKTISEKVNRAAHLLEIEDLLNRHPNQLSGGQMQRVAIGKAIVRNPKVFLMDEPLSNLDSILKNKMREEIKNLHQKMGGTFVYVTHDQTEALTLATKLVVINEGKIQQIGTPYEVFKKPENLFVAKFIGIPQINLFDCKVLNERDTSSFTLFSHEYCLNKKINESKIIVGIRADDFYFSKSGTKCKINTEEVLGSEAIYLCSFESLDFKVKNEIRLNSEKENKFSVKLKNVLFFDSITKERCG